jgi:6-phosphogluconolactonase
VTRTVEVYDTKDALVDAVVERTAAIVIERMRETGWCMWALSGGSTPRDAFRKLASEPYRDRIAWNRVHVFWGDERTVPPGHEDSNYRMAREALLDPLAIPEANIHRIEAERGAEEAAAHYESEMKRLFESELPRFDVVWLGMGDDGHTASLFPGTGAVDVTGRLVIPVHVPQLDTWRVSMTLPVLNAAREVFVLVAGAEKADMVRRVMDLSQPAPDLPVSMVAPVDGTVRWMLDREAAHNLD